MKQVLKVRKFSCYKFRDRQSIKFSRSKYSKMKHGSGEAASSIGYEMAETFYQKYESEITNKEILIMESPYSTIKSASSVITDYFIQKLNHLITSKGGNCTKRQKVNRESPYVEDYGSLSLTGREDLLKEDRFTFDSEFAKDKFMIFIDDILITGTHQKKIEQMLEEYSLPISSAICVYYAELINPEMDPSIESYLNIFSIDSVDKLIDLINTDNDYHIIIRTVKLLLSSSKFEFETFLEEVDKKLLKELYYVSLGKNYFKEPKYSDNFSLLKEHIQQITI